MLNAVGIKTVEGSPWTSENVRKQLKRNKLASGRDEL